MHRVGVYVRYLRQLWERRRWDRNRIEAVKTLHEVKGEASKSVDQFERKLREVEGLFRHVP